MSRCININNGNVKKLSDITGLPAAAIAAKIAVWQDNGNEGKIPTQVDLGMPFLPWAKNIELYKKYNLLNVEGSIKELLEKEAKSWANTNNGSPEYYFEARQNASKKWVISIAKRLWNKNDSGQLPLFNKSEPENVSNDIVINILETFKNRFKIDYEIISPAEAQGLLESAKHTYSGEPAFFFKGKVYMVDEGNGLDWDSAIHEYGHPFMRALNKYNPALFQNIIADILSTLEGKKILEEVRELGYSKSEEAEEVAVRALTALSKQNFDVKTGKLFQSAIDKLLRFLTSMLKKVFGKEDLKLSTLSPDTTLQQLSDIFSLKQGLINLRYQNDNVEYELKAVNILSSLKADEIFRKGDKNGWSLEKMLTELAIPKEQQELIKSFGTRNREEILTSLLANYSYTVEINTAKTKMNEGMNDDFVYYKGYRWYSNEDGFFKTDGYSGMKRITEQEYLEAFNSKQEINTSHYSNLTVPGGTNYTENEISTPAITPSIKGHAQFSTDKGIGWFRSDEQNSSGQVHPDLEQLEEDYKDGGLTENEYKDELQRLAEQGIYRKNDNIKGSKTRRILEVQSDLFQKGRNKELLTNIPKNKISWTNSRGITITIKNYNDLLAEGKNLIEVDYDGETKMFNKQDILDVPAVKNIITTQNQFLQLLNKNNNWVTFFIKSIIQDSAKKGYEKVLFPSGDTTSKVEGHTTLEEFKKQKEDRIKELEKKQLKPEYSVSFVNSSGYDDYVFFDNLKEATEYYLKKNKEIEKYKNDPDFEGGYILFNSIETNNREINRLKEELERIEKEGFGALKPIYNFYENTVTNILKKNYTVKQIRDEYGNTWNEVEIKPEHLEKVSFNRKTATQKQIYDKINPTGKISKEGDEYVVLGEKGYKRVTTLTQKKFNLGNKDTELGQFLGNVFHAVAANAVKEAFPDFNTHFKTIDSVEGVGKNVDLNSIPEASKKNILAIIKPVIEAAKKSGSVLIAELPVANTKTKIAGTIDLLEITKDNDVKTLDYKTSMKKGTTKSNYKKLLGNSEQQILYKKVLAYDDELLGREGLDIKYQELMKVMSSVKDSVPTFRVLETSPVIYQTTLDKRKNEMLGELFNQIKQLDNKKDKANAEKTNALMAAKLKLMQNIQKSVKEKEMLGTIMEDLIAIEVFISENKGVGSYIEFRRDLSLYENLGYYIDITDENKYLIETIQGRAKRLYQSMYVNIEDNFAEQAAKDLAFEGGPIQSAEDVLKPVADINSWQANLKGASYTNNPIVAYIYKTVSAALGKARTEASNMSSKIAKSVRNLESYMGKTGESIYEPLLQYYNGKKTGYVVDKYSSEFYEARKKARKNSDINWFKDNTSFDQETYDRKKKSYENFLESRFKADLTIKIKKLKESKKFKDEVIDREAANFVKKDHAELLKNWVAENKNIMLFNLPSDKWIDPRWREIKEGKYKGTAVEEFYDMYVSTMEKIEEMVPFDIRKNYIAEFRRSFLERVMTNGVGDMRLGESLIKSLQLESDESYLERNPFTNLPIRNIPILGKINIAFKDREKFITDEKSYDLGKSLSVFFESAIRYQELSIVEEVHEVGRDVLLKQKEAIITATGQPAKGGFDLFKSAKGLQNTIDNLDYFIQSTVYGKSEQEGTAFTIEKESFAGKVLNSLGLMGDKDELTISRIKLMNNILRYTGLNNLGYNLYSPITNLLGGKSMQLLTGAGDRWFSLKDYSFASAVVTLGPFSNLTGNARKARLFAEMFQLESSEYSQERKEEARSGLQAFSKIPGPMAGMSHTESHMQNTGLIAMIKSDKHSIKWSEWEVVDDKLVYKGEEMSPETIEAFRQKVIHVNGRSLGNMNPEDKIRIKQWFLGRAVTQHRGWIPAMLEAHWSSERYDYMLNEYVEGRLNSLIKFVTVKKFDWKSLSNGEKANVKEAFAEIAIILLAYGLYAAAWGADEDKEKRKRLAYLLKVLSRYKSEMMFFTGLGYEDAHKILISPAPSISTLEKFGRLLGNIKDVMVEDEKEAEKAKKKLGKSAGQMVPYWSQASRFFEDIVQSEIEEK